jgi:4-hydroxybutyryl-CoA dehydratase/vinylacetyl-CoA-Delta-isomerase
MPSLKELKNPEVKDYVKEFYSFGSDVSTETIMKVHKLLQNWTAGQHGVATWHGAGPVMANKIMLQRVIDYEPVKKIVKQTLGLKEKKNKAKS